MVWYGAVQVREAVLGLTLEAQALASRKGEDARNLRAAAEKGWAVWRAGGAGVLKYMRLPEKQRAAELQQLKMDCDALWQEAEQLLRGATADVLRTAQVPRRSPCRLASIRTFGAREAVAGTQYVKIRNVIFVNKE